MKYSVMVQRTTYSVQHTAYDRTVIHALAAQLQTLIAASAMAQQAPAAKRLALTYWHLVVGGGH